ncbi:rhamnogalacturonan lyase family protein [Micromonospora sp. CPCC 206061]|uniref:rhamnogalacturonan lyase family protein n=1 Tax=Micromonospora sp. CPCC 206061 TaxID=3122410 RepID=UPI002FF1F5DC
MLSRRRRRAALLSTTIAAVVAGSAGVIAVVLPASAAAGCRVDYAISSQWSGGFGANVTITNLGDPINGWTLTWAYTAGQTVTQAWNATVTQSASQVTATNASYNGAIATNANVAFGFNGSWNNSSNPVPATFTLNGTACTGSVGATTGAPTSAPPTSSAPTSAPPTTLPPTSPPPTSGNGKQMEDLNRGLISVRSGSGNLVSWRLFGYEAASTAFNVYRGSTKVNATPITNSTNYLDSGAAADASYTVRAVVNGAEQGASESSLRFTGGGHLDVPISAPGGGYVANDASVGDLDGDGQYEIVLKWDPDNAKDNSQAGVTGNVFVDAYRLNGTRLWRIDLGVNIRAGAHYTQFQVYDYDGDGRAEVAMKTADGTRSGTGQVVGNASANHRNADGYILAGPEFLTMFRGTDGAVLSTVNYEPPRGTVSSWGDSYGNRVDRFLAATAYLDGQRPSLIMARGYYTRAVVVAWDFRNGSLVRRWTYDSGNSNTGAYGQGNHNLSVADVDNDGRQEIVYGSATIDDNGALMYRTGFGHGDAMHVGDLIPARSGIEVFTIHESSSAPAADVHDGRTGQIIWQRPGNGGAEGPGRGVAADVYAGSPGAEFWGAGTQMSNLYNASGASVGRTPSSANFVIWWDADPVRELLDQTRIDKYGTGGDTRLLTGSGVASNNGTKATPALSGDILGDWREEVIWRTSDNSALRIYSTPTPTTTKIFTLAHDAQYRVALAWQNTAYNQPPHPSFFIGDGMSTPPQPAIYVR